MELEHRATIYELYMPRNGAILVPKSMYYALLIRIPKGIQASDKSLEGRITFKHTMVMYVWSFVAISARGGIIEDKHAATA